MKQFLYYSWTVTKIERELIEVLIDDALSRSKRLGVLGKRIAKAQAKLRSRVDDRAWASYLAVEEATNERTSKQLRVLFKRMLALYASGTLRR